jgi:hypothetical protein
MLTYAGDEDENEEMNAFPVAAENWVAFLMQQARV